MPQPRDEAGKFRTFASVYEEMSDLLSSFLAALEDGSSDGIESAASVLLSASSYVTGLTPEEAARLADVLKHPSIEMLSTPRWYDLRDLAERVRVDEASERDEQSLRRLEQRFGSTKRKTAALNR